jgi:hypothetical protein
MRKRIRRRKRSTREGEDERKDGGEVGIGRRIGDE